MKYYCTFKSNMMTAKDKSLGESYVIIDKPTWEEAQKLMHNLRGNDWGQIFSSPEKAGIYQHHMHEVTLEYVRLYNFDK